MMTLFPGIKMMLAFLVDQVQALCDSLFQQAQGKARTHCSLWERIRVLFDYFEWESWEKYYGMIAGQGAVNGS